MCNMTSYKVNMNVHAAKLEEVSIKGKSRTSEFDPKMKVRVRPKEGGFFKTKADKED